MPRPKRKPDAPETRDSILRAARIEFSAHGLSAPLDAIASRCGIRRPSLLHHFPSKKALIEAVVDDLIAKARLRLVSAISEGQGDYAQTMVTIMQVLRELEREEVGVGGVLLHATLAEQSGGEAEAGFVTQRMIEFVDIIYSTALIAGANRDRSAAEVKAVIAHLLIGEVARLAIGPNANHIWGEADGVDPLFQAYFLAGSEAK